MEFAKTLLNIIGIQKLQRLLKNYVDQVIDKRVKEILTNEKLDNVVHQLTLEDVEYLEYIKNSSDKSEPQNFADRKFIKLKLLGLINESIDYKISNENLKEMQMGNITKKGPLVAYITFNEDCEEICRIVKDMVNKSIKENHKKANDLAKARDTAIIKFSKK